MNLSQIILQFECCFCSTVCGNRNAVEAHLATKHFNYDPFQCEECRLIGRHAKFPTEFMLKQHCFGEHKLKEFYFRTWVSAEIEEKRVKIADSMKRCKVMPPVLPRPSLLQLGLVVPPASTSYEAFYTLKEVNATIPPPPPPPVALNKIERPFNLQTPNKENFSKVSTPTRYTERTDQQELIETNYLQFMPSQKEFTTLLGVDVENLLASQMMSRMRVEASPNFFKDSAECLQFMVNLYKKMSTNPKYKGGKGVSKKINRAMKEFKKGVAFSEDGTYTPIQSTSAPSTETAATKERHTFMPTKEKFVELLGEDVNNFLVARIPTEVSAIAKSNTFKDTDQCLQVMINIYNMMAADPMFYAGKEAGINVKSAVKRIMTLVLDCPDDKENSPPPKTSFSLPSATKTGKAKRRVNFACDIVNIDSQSADSFTVDFQATTNVDPVVMEPINESTCRSSSTIVPASANPTPAVVKEDGKIKEDCESIYSSSSIEVITLDDDSDQENRKEIANIISSESNDIEAADSTDTYYKFLQDVVKQEKRQKAKKTVFSTDENRAKRLRES